jgi:hypothetical protein
MFVTVLGGYLEDKPDYGDIDLAYHLRLNINLSIGQNIGSAVTIISNGRGIGGFGIRGFRDHPVDLALYRELVAGRVRVQS